MLDLAPIWTPPVQQRNYRALLEAMARPGTRQLLQTQDEQHSSLAVLATLLDGEVSLADPWQRLSDQDWRLLQAVKEDAAKADFVLCDGSQVPDWTPKLGTLPSPERSATLVIAVASLQGGELALRLQGPGIETSCEIAIEGLHADWIDLRAQWTCAFPLGVDLILVDRQGALALPRTCKVEVR